MRLGWITSVAQFHEQIIALTGSSRQHMHVFAQIFLSEVRLAALRLRQMGDWPRDGVQEKRRCDSTLDVFAQEDATAEYAEAIPSEAGRFARTRDHVDEHMRYRREQARDGEWCSYELQDADEELVVQVEVQYVPSVDMDTQCKDSEGSTEDVSASSWPIRKDCDAHDRVSCRSSTPVA